MVDLKEVETMDGFKIGELVVINLGDCGFTFHDKWGKITSFSNDDHKDGPVEVQIDERFKYLFDSEKARKIGKLRFETSELLKEENADLKTRTTILFGNNMWHHIKHFEGKGKICMVRGCTEESTTETMYNYWGTVLVFRTCQKCHNEHHGKCGERTDLLG